MHGDVDLIADFADDASIEAADSAESLCYAEAMRPDVIASAYVSEPFKTRVMVDAVVLS